MSGLSEILTERAVLAGIINYGSDVYLDVSDILNTESFTDDQYQAIWKCLYNFFQNKNLKKIDVTGILSTAKELGLTIFFNDDNKIKSLKNVINFYTEPDNVVNYAKKLRKLQIGRDLISALGNAQKELNKLTGNETVNEILTVAESPIFKVIDDVLGSEKQEVNRLGDTIDAQLTNIEENLGASVGVPTGFPEYDETIGGGLRRGSVGVIAARLKQGKSFLLNNIGLYITKNLNIPILAIDTEMEYNEHNIRLLANLSSIKKNDIEKGEYLKKDYTKKKLYEARDIIKTLAYDHISVAGKNFEEIISIMRRWVIKRVGYDASGKTNPCVIFYDYLKIMDNEDVAHLSEFQVLGLQMTKLHNFAVQYNVPILAFAQVNRDGLSAETTGIIAGSDRIGWLCSHLSILKAKSPEEIGRDGVDLGNRKLVVLAARHGPGHQMNDYIHIGANLSYGRLEELGSLTRPKRKQDEKFDTQEVVDLVF